MLSVEECGATGKGWHGCPDSLRLGCGGMGGDILTGKDEVWRYGRGHFDRHRDQQSLGCNFYKDMKPWGGGELSFVLGGQECCPPCPRKKERRRQNTSV